MIRPREKVAAAFVVAVALLAGCRRDERPAPAAPQGGANDVISETKAIELARAACVGKAEIPPGVQAHATFARGRYIVFFPTNLPAGTRGADYHAKVTLNARTGAVIEVLAGS